MPSYMDYMVDRVQRAGIAKDSQDNAAGTASAAAPGAGQRYIITKADGSFTSSTISKLLQVKVGATVIDEKYIHGAGAIDFGFDGYQVAENTAISAVLEASGTGAVLGKVTLKFYTTGI